MGSASRLRKTAAVMESLWTSKPTQKLTDDGMGLVSCRFCGPAGPHVALVLPLTSDANPRFAGGQPFHRVYAEALERTGLDKPWSGAW